jgi:hypothetical protein
MKEYLLAIDPGGKRNGLARWNWATGESTHRWVLNYPDMQMFLDKLATWPLHAIVIEDYIIRPGKNHGSRGETIKIIGLTEAVGRRLNVPVIKQQPQDMYMAKLWEEDHSKGHVKDELSAFYHGNFYLRKFGKYKTKLERDHSGT